MEKLVKADSGGRSAKCRCGGFLSSNCTEDSTISFSVGESSPRRPISIRPLKTKISREELCWESVSRNSSVPFPSINSPSPMTSVELRKEIATLEADIMHLERYLLLLYRTAFKDQGSSLSNIPTPCMLDKFDNGQTSPDSSTPSLHSKREKLVQRAVILRRFGEKFPFHGSAASIDLDHRDVLQSSSVKEQTEFVSGRQSLADYFEFSRVLEDVKTPVSLSEDMIKSISSIYCRIATSLNPASPIHTSSFTSSSLFSMKNSCSSSASHSSRDSDLQNWIRNVKRENAPSPETIEVVSIRLDNDSFNDVASVFKHYRSLVQSLENVDPQKMKREEKVAFWINIHNALIMHAYLVFGTENRARDKSCSKAVYNVGGHSVNALTIQQCIFGIRSHFPERWLQTLFSPSRKPKKGHVFALDYSEPQVHFALCSGAHSDPMVRVYTAKNIFEELKTAKEEYIQCCVSIHNGQKIFVPKLLSLFAKDMAMNVAGILKVINESWSEVDRNKCPKGKRSKVCWSEQNTTFRYLIHGELGKERHI